MSCSCHDPVVFGHLECGLSPRGHIAQDAAERIRSVLTQQRNEQLIRAAETPMSYKEWRRMTARIIREYRRQVVRY